MLNLFLTVFFCALPLAAQAAPGSDFNPFAASAAQSAPKPTATAMEAFYAGFPSQYADPKTGPSAKIKLQGIFAQVQLEYTVDEKGALVKLAIPRKGMPVAPRGGGMPAPETEPQFPVVTQDQFLAWLKSGKIMTIIVNEYRNSMGDAVSSGAPSGSNTVVASSLQSIGGGGGAYGGGSTGGGILTAVTYQVTW